MIVSGEFASLNIKEAADFLGLHPDTLQARAKAGVIPGAKIGKEWRFINVDLVAYMRSQYGKEETPRPPERTAYRGSKYLTASDELDALLEETIRRGRKGKMTNSRQRSGK